MADKMGLPGLKCLSVVAFILLVAIVVTAGTNFLNPVDVLVVYNDTPYASRYVFIDVELTQNSLQWDLFFGGR